MIIELMLEVIAEIIFWQSKMMLSKLEIQTRLSELAMAHKVMSTNQLVSSISSTVSLHP